MKSKFFFKFSSLKPFPDNFFSCQLFWLVLTVTAAYGFGAVATGQTEKANVDAADGTADRPANQDHPIPTVSGRLNNIDVRQRAFDRIDLVGASNRSTDTMDFWALDGQARSLKPIGSIQSKLDAIYGFCLGKDLHTGGRRSGNLAF